MFDDLNAYFHENVWATFKEYQKVRKTFKAGVSNDLRSAINIATILYHLREHLPPLQRKSREAIASICPDYNILGDIVNASKHNTLTKGKPKINYAKDIYEAIIITEYKDKLGEYRHITKSVFVKLNDGTERDVHEIIVNVLNMWLIELNAIGVINHINPVEIKSNKIPRRTKNSGRLDLTAIRGVRLHQVMKFYKYNYETNIGIRVKNDNGEEFEIKISVNEKQKKQFSTIENDEKKLIFFLKIAEKQGKICNLKIDKQNIQYSLIKE